jgi:arylsulfatase A-like enzyme
MRRFVHSCSVLFLALVAFILTFDSPAIAADAVSGQPNIVVFLVDDMGVMDSSVAFLTDDQGAPKRYPLNEFYRTPNMERMASQGIRFSQFCAMSVCSPTRISIMTGQNAARHRTTNWINPDTDNAGPQGAKDWNWKGLGKDDVTLAKLLQSRGYRTIHVGKGHFGPRDSEGEDPCNIGFDVNVGGSSIGQPGSYYGKQNYGAKAKRVTHPVPHLEKYHESDTFLTEALTREAMTHMTLAVDEKRPFFLHLAHYAVHAPFNTDPRYASHYQGSDKKGPAQAFASLIEGMDKSLGDIMAHLNELGVAENTLVLMLGDNGTDAPLGNEHAVACAAPLRGKKGSHYEGGSRVPFLASWALPNTDVAIQKQWPIAAAAVQTQQASVMDLFPTILSVTGTPQPDEHAVDGKSLATLFTGKSDSNREETFLIHYPHAPHRSSHWTSYRRGEWKVIYHYFPSTISEDSHYQLFHLGRDPFEQQNLAKSEPKELQRMMQQLVKSLEDHNALYPIANDGTDILPIVP